MLVVTCSYFGVGQTTLNKKDVYYQPATYIYELTTKNSISPISIVGQSGNIPAVWDFRSVSSNLLDTLEHTVVNDTFFIRANHQQSNNMLNITANAVYQTGIKDHFNPKFQPRLTTIQFPMDYGNSFYDSTRIEGIPDWYARSIYSEVDGYGTLITKFGIYPNCLRKKDIIIDYYIDGESYDTTYSYFSTIIGSYIVQVSRVKSEYNWPTPSVYRHENIRVFKNWMGPLLYVGTEPKITIKETPIMVYPNPVKGNKVFIEFTKEFVGEFNVIDQLGKNILSQKVVSSRTIELNTEGYSTGIYQLIFSNKQTTITQKLVIE